jgi:hypothetical protein
MLPNENLSNWASISRPIEIPEWAVAAVERNRARISELVDSDVRPKIDIIASIDWRSLVDFDSGYPDIRIDWTLIEFTLLASFLESGALREVSTSGIFDDVFGSAVFNKYKPAENVLIGELQRLLCWKSIQKDSYFAARFFYNRFMNYCAHEQGTVESYLNVLRGNSVAGEALIDFLVGHEAAHFCRDNPDRLSTAGMMLRNVSEMPLNRLSKEYVETVGRHKLDFAQLTELISNPANQALIEELQCDAFSTFYMLDIVKGPPTVKAFRSLLSYAQTTHLVGWITALECALFDDDSESKTESYHQIVKLQPVRSYFLTNHIMFSLGGVMVRTGEAEATEIGRVIEASQRFIDWLDHTLSLLLEKVIDWRFQLRDMGPSSFWLKDEIDTMVDHLRRYPRFNATDYAAAKRLSDTLPRGWQVRTE